MRPWTTFHGLSSTPRSDKSRQRIAAFYNWRKSFYTKPVAGFQYNNLEDAQFTFDLNRDVKTFIDNGFKFYGYDEPLFYSS